MTAPHRTEIPGPEWAALVTVETVERLVAKASDALQAGDLDRVRALFGAIVDETTIRTATQVKDPALSDGIARQATIRVRAALAMVAAELALDAERARDAEAEHDAATDRAIAEHEAALDADDVDWLGRHGL